jgi:dephospho-CoA kinase
MKGLVYLISGKICSGKDYVANVLVKHKNFKRYAFADKLKDEVSEELLIERKLLDSQFGKAILYRNGRTYRTMLIEHAKYQKNKNIDYFTDIIAKHIISERSDRVVISDFRYPHEYSRLCELLKESHRIVTVNVSRDYCLRLNIESETSLDEFEHHMLIDNNKDENHVLEQFNSKF